MVSPPGSGKTTLVPLALLRDLADLIPAGQKLLLLEPRRMAARAAAWRMAAIIYAIVGVISTPSLSCPSGNSVPRNWRKESRHR